MHELLRIEGLAKRLIDTYAGQSSRTRTGEIHQAVYDDVIDFVNFRVETASTALHLAVEGSVADSFGLSRSLLEHLMLLKLMVRGTRFFQLAVLAALSPAEFAERLKEEIATWEFARAAGTTDCLEVLKYPRTARAIMYVFDGLKSDDPSDVSGFVVPMHYFLFRDFRPETLRLTHEDYFQYYEPVSELKAARKRHRAEAQHHYRHYLSYDGMLECLELNGLVTSRTERHIEAHYTFLGRFLHPTHNAARVLHERSNWYSSVSMIGMSSPYLTEARLLAAAYVCHLLADIFAEVCYMLDHAPSKYISSPGTEDLASAIAGMRLSVPYLWFIDNEPSPYDKFNWVSNHASDDQLAQADGYLAIPAELVTFNMSVWDHFKNSMGSWSSQRCGVYVPPFGI